MKRTRNLGLLTAAAVLALAAGWGCGDGTPSVSSSTETVKVKGTVTLNGKPITDGKILFDAANVNRREAPTASLEIGKDGTYSGETLIGENSVTVTGPAISKGAPDLSMNRKEVKLEAGENTVDITLP